MGQKIIHFFKYNNAFTLALMFLFLSTGTIFAANEDMRASVISSQDHLIAVDNEHIIKVNLSKYEPQIKILEITEDDEAYYVTYRMNTIEIVDGVWSDVSNEAELVVNKVQLEDKDLGLFVAEELQEVADAQLSYLREVQSLEKNLGQQDRQIEKKYSGLLGRLLDSKTASFKGYKPVIPPEKRPVPPDRDAQIAALIQQKLERQEADRLALAEQQAAAEAAAQNQPQPTEEEPEETEEETDETPPANNSSSTNSGNTNGSSTSQSTSTPSATSSSQSATTSNNTPDTTPPIVKLKGDANVSLVIGETYTESGAIATDDVDGALDNITITGSVDVNTAGIYEIVYTATDAAGNQATKTRTVEVTEPIPSAGSQEPASSSPVESA